MTLKKPPKNAPKPRGAVQDTWAPKSVADTLVKFWQEPDGTPYDFPRHLAPITHECDEAVFGEGDRRCCIAAPVQHGKTQLVLAALLTFALVKPGKTHSYAAYSATRADEVRGAFEIIAHRAGLEPAAAGDRLMLKGGTSIRFISIEGASTGSPVTGLSIVDDYHKGWTDAHSAPHRKRVISTYNSAIATRLHPGASLLIVAARWSPNDLSAYVCKSLPPTDDRPALPGMRYIRIPAVCDVHPDPLGRRIGDALWPEKRPIQWLQQWMRDPMVWAALYQQHPTSEGDLIFGEAHWYSPLAIPMIDRRYGWGLDLAFSVAVGSDHSVLLGGCRVKHQLFVTHCVRRRCDPETFKTMAVATYLTQRPAPCTWFASGPETAWAAKYRNAGMTKLRSPSAGQYGDKAQRATLSGLLSSWNEGRVLLPEGAPWAADVAAEIEGFTGDRHQSDDIVDAAAGLCHAVGFDSRGATYFGVNELNDRLRGHGFGAQYDGAAASGRNRIFPSGVDQHGQPLPRRRRAGAAVWGSRGDS